MCSHKFFSLAMESKLLQGTRAPAFVGDLCVCPFFVKKGLGRNSWVTAAAHNAIPRSFGLCLLTSIVYR